MRTAWRAGNLLPSSRCRILKAQLSDCLGLEQILRCNLPFWVPAGSGWSHFCRTFPDPVSSLSAPPTTFSTSLVSPGGTSLIDCFCINHHLRVCFWGIWTKTWPQILTCHPQLGFYKCCFSIETWRCSAAEVRSPSLFFPPVSFYSCKNSVLTPPHSLLYAQHLWAVNLVLAPNVYHSMLDYIKLQNGFQCKTVVTVSYLPNLPLAGWRHKYKSFQSRSCKSGAIIKHYYYKVA